MLNAFVNRDNEIEYLLSHITSLNSSVVIVRAPTGFGKSGLTDEAIRRAGSQLPLTALVDAYVRTKSVALYDGYFVQQAVQALGHTASPTFAEFVVGRRWRTAWEKKASDAIRKYPNASTLYAYLVDYFDRFTGRGAFAPKTLLLSDSAQAVQICREYLSSIVQDNMILILLREAQHIDLESLAFFLQLQQQGHLCHLIIEYTSMEPEFSPDHAKVLQRELEEYKNVHILDLQRLERKHLEFLLREQVDESITLTSECYAQWNGNLRTISEIKYRVGFGRKIASNEELIAALPHFSDQLVEHIRALSRHEQLVLVTLLAHISPIHLKTLNQLIQRLGLIELLIDLDDVLCELETHHYFIHGEGDRYRLDNEDIAMAIERLPECRGLVNLARQNLREIYLERLRNQDYLTESAARCLHQAITLCAATDEIAGLLNTTHQLTKTIATSNDQAAFVDVIAKAIHDTRSGYTADLEQLTNWAVGIAYDTGNFQAVVDLLSSHWRKSPEMALIFVSSLLETDGHIRASEVLDEAAIIWPLGSVSIGIELSRAMLARFENRKDEVRIRLENALALSREGDIALTAYAHRFFESIDEFPDSTGHVMQSADMFSLADLPQPEAYSRLAASLHLSREGRVNDALAQIDHAESLLEGYPRAGYLVLNNRAATWLNKPNAEYAACLALLRTAFGFARDEFALTVILCNQAICLWQLEQMDAAVSVAKHALLILQNPSYHDRDIRWSTGFNIANIFEAAGSIEEAHALRDRIITQEPEPIIYPKYWQVRFGLATNISDLKYRHMMQLPYHPLFLSHWQFDRAGLRDLTSVPPQ